MAATIDQRGGRGCCWEDAAAALHAWGWHTGLRIACRMGLESLGSPILGGLIPEWSHMAGNHEDPKWR